MALYAIGDIQGCYDDLLRLLQRLRFDPAQDRLWLVGDLVNRGPRSLDTLRWARRMDASLTCVLGNHDLHLLALAAGSRRRAGRDDLQDILQAADAVELIEWLRHRPLAHYDAALDALLVHAGLPPGWDAAQAVREARLVERELRGAHWRDSLLEVYGDRPNRWDESLSGRERLRFTVNALTRMRFCRADGSLDFSPKGPPDSGKNALVPWFQHPRSSWGSTRVVAGHWSALGFYQRPGLVMLDTGCVWGGKLTALRLDAADALPIGVSCGT